MQNINLLEDIELPQRSVITSKLVLKVVGLLVLVLLVISIFCTAKLSRSKESLTALGGFQQKLIAKIISLEKKDDSPNHGNGVDSTGHKMGSTINFYGYLHDIAKHTPKNVWLTTIALSQAENMIMFRGHALSASDVTNFISNLKSSSSMRNRAFNTVQIRKNENTREIDFTIATDVMGQL